MDRLAGQDTTLGFLPIRERKKRNPEKPSNVSTLSTGEGAQGGEVLIQGSCRQSVAPTVPEDHEEHPADPRQGDPPDEEGGR